MSQRNFISNDPRRKESEMEMDSVEDLKLEEKPLLIAADKPPQSNRISIETNKSAQGSLDQSIFSGDTPDYFYEMRKAAEEDSPAKDVDNFRSEPRLRSSPSRDLNKRFEAAQDINSMIQSSIQHSKTNLSSMAEAAHVIRFDSHQSKSEREIRHELDKHTPKPDHSHPTDAHPQTGEFKAPAVTDFSQKHPSIDAGREPSLKSAGSLLANRSFKADLDRRQDTPMVNKYSSEDKESVPVVPQLTPREGDSVPKELPKLTPNLIKPQATLTASDQKTDTYDEANLQLPIFKPERTLDFIGSTFIFESNKENLSPALREHSQILKNIITSNFIDFDFPPLIDNIVDDLRDPLVSKERRMEWRRLKFLCKQKVHRVWERGMPYKAADACASGSLVIRAVENLLEERHFEEFYLGGNLSKGLHDFVLFNSLGDKVVVRVDDFVPVDILDGNKTHVSFLQPATKGDSVFFFPSLLEKALSKLFGGYMLLHKAPLLSLRYSLFGPTPLSSSLDHSKAFQIDSSMNCVAFTATKDDYQLCLFLLVDPHKSHKAKDSLVHIEVFNEEVGLIHREERPAATLGLLRFQLKSKGKYFFSVKLEDFRMILRLPVTDDIADVRVLDTDECMKLRRAFIRRFPFTQTDSEMLKEVSLQFEVKGLTVLCKIQNYSKLKDKPVRILGIEDWRDWNIEFNGNNIRKGNGRFISTAGNEEEYLRIFATRQVEAEVCERLRILIN